MIARKRSGAIVGSCLALVVLAGCSSEPAVSASAIANRVGAVDVLRTEAEHMAGARPYRLRVGDSLVFAFSEPTTPVWTMRGVRWPLRLDAYDERGEVVESWLMTTCAPLCLDVRPEAEAAVWVETRVKRPARMDAAGRIDPETGKPWKGDG